jgi:hypothetical protein
MRNTFGILAALVFIVGTALAQSSPVGPVIVASATCVTCLAPGNSEEGCTANYGVDCGPNEEFDHCTAEQAAAWCPGWAEEPPEETPTCAVCRAGEAVEGSCYANYGAQCNPVPGLSHCTEAQARDWCAGWAERMTHLNPTTLD